MDTNNLDFCTVMLCALNLVFLVGLGYATAQLAEKKGRSRGTGWALGLLLGVWGLLIVALMSDQSSAVAYVPREQPASQPRLPPQKQCPQCGTSNPESAQHCMTCGAELYAEEQVLDRARREGNRKLEADMLGALGNRYAAAGNIQKGVEYHEQALQIRMSLGDGDGAAKACHNLAGIYEMALHDLSTATKYIEQAAQLAVSPGKRARYSERAEIMRKELTGSGE